MTCDRTKTIYKDTLTRGSGTGGMRRERTGEGWNGNSLGEKNTGGTEKQDVRHEGMISNTRTTMHRIMTLSVHLYCWAWCFSSST